jgi:hypothetical protein
LAALRRFARPSAADTLVKRRAVAIYREIILFSGLDNFTSALPSAQYVNPIKTTFFCALQPA